MKTKLKMAAVIALVIMAASLAILTPEAPEVENICREYNGSVVCYRP